MKYWLMKTEADTFSIDDLSRKGREHWDGVRNFMARNNMKAMRKGDLALFYHTGDEKAVVGVAKVVREAYPDFTQFDRKSKYFDSDASPDKPRWYMVDVSFEEKLKRPVTLKEIKESGDFDDMVLVQASRLSVQPVGKKHFEEIMKLSKK